MKLENQIQAEPAQCAQMQMETKTGLRNVRKCKLDPKQACAHCAVANPVGNMPAHIALWQIRSETCQRTLRCGKSGQKHASAHCAVANPVKSRPAQIALTQTLRKYVQAFCFFILSLSTYAQGGAKTFCSLEIYDVHTKERRVVCSFPHRIEAPNWTVDGKYLVFNSDGKLFKIDIRHPEKIEQINTGFALRCNNDHVLSASGKRIAISHGTKEDGRSRVYTLPMKGGTPQLITPLAPSYLHGWSPDEKWLAYCAQRGGNYDVYVVPAEGGEEKRLTDADGLDDGPEYSPDGKYIWFNSVRTGNMQVWRMKIDGTEQTQMTADEAYHSWFPHVSPDGKQVVCIAYRSGDVAAGDHPPGKNVVLRLMPASGGTPVTVVELFGGQGTINVNSWSPDSRKFAFVSYERPAN